MKANNVELAVRSCLSEIRNKIKHPCRCTAINVWGNEVIFKPNNRLGILQPWCITYTIDPTWDLKTLVNNVITFFSISASAYEKAMADRLKNMNVKNIVCNEFSDWNWPLHGSGKIINNNEIAIIKYGLMTKDFDIDD